MTTQPSPRYNVRPGADNPTGKSFGTWEVVDRTDGSVPYSTSTKAVACQVATELNRAGE